MPKNKSNKNPDSKALPLEQVLVFDYRPSVKSINGLMKKSAQSLLDVGKVLFDAKTEAQRLGAMDDYKSMFNELRFTYETGNKFIQMYTDKTLKLYIEHCPPYWNSIYSHLRGWTTEEWDKMIKLGGLNYMSSSNDIYNIKQKALGDRERVKEEAKAKAEADAKKKVKAEEKADTKSNDDKKGDEPKSVDTPSEDYVPKSTSNASEKLKGAKIKVDDEKEEDSLELKYDGFDDQIMHIDLSVSADSKTTLETLNNVNKLIDDIEKYTKEKIKTYKLSDYCSVDRSKELTATELGIIIEDESSKEDDAEIKVAA